MQVGAFVKLQKRVEKAGTWKCGALDPKGKMGPKAFDFGSRRPFILGRKWHWRVDELDCAGMKARLLIAYELGDEKYLAWLSLKRESDTVIVACYEFHGDHPGWHFHARCCSINDLQPGLQRQRDGGKRLPKGGNYHRDLSYEMSPIEAINRAYRAFNVGLQPEDTML